MHSLIPLPSVTVPPSLRVYPGISPVLVWTAGSNISLASALPHLSALLFRAAQATQAQNQWAALPTRRAI